MSLSTSSAVQMSTTRFAWVLWPLILSSCDGFASSYGTLRPPGVLAGEAVALDGGVAVVGAVGSNEASVFERNSEGWHITGSLRPSDRRRADPTFAQTVDASGDIVVVGAPAFGSPSDDPGHAYVYERSGAGWAEVAALSPADLAPNATFGGAVSVSGHRVAVGGGNDACSATETGPRCGRVRVFTGASGWSEVAVLDNPAPEPFNGFARQLDMDGGYLAVGVSTTVVTDTRAPGRVYVFRESGGWKVEGYVESPAGATRNFGESAVALDGETLAVADVLGQPFGVVYVFRRSGSGGTWTLEATLASEDLGQLATFGRRIDLSGSRLVVAAPGRSYDGRSLGGAFVYARSADGEWTQEAELRSPDNVVGFGRDVAISGDRVLVGANDTESNGGAYEFVREGSSWLVAGE